MATLNLQQFIATLNSFARRDERVPVWIHAKQAGYEVPEELELYADRLANYLDGMRLFGQEQGRKEDGFGERTYHLIDLETIINIFRSIGIAKSYPDFMTDFPKEAGWDWVECFTSTEEVEGVKRYTRTVSLGGETLDDIAKAIQDGTCAGLDCVDWNGIVYRNCTLLKIKDLHPDVVKTARVFDPETDSFIEKEVPVKGVDSELYLIVTPECLNDGYTVIEGEEEASLKGSHLLRTPLGFVAMRRTRPGDVVTRFPKGTALLKTMCPVTHDYREFDDLIAKATLVIQDTNIPGAIYQAIVQHNQQAFLSPEHLVCQREMLEYALSPKEEKDGTANIYKNWMKLTGQHYSISHILAEALTVFNAVPRVVDERGGRAGQDLRYVMLRVADIEFNWRWAILEEFQAIINPNGYHSGTSSIKASNPVPYYIHTLNPETLEWEKSPVTKWTICDTRGRKFFTRAEDPFTLVDVNALGDATIHPLPDIHKRIEEQHTAMVESLKKED